MKANCWFGSEDVRVVDVPDPKILNPRDAIIKITSTAIENREIVDKSIRAPRGAERLLSMLNRYSPKEK